MKIALHRSLLLVLPPLLLLLVTAQPVRAAEPATLELSAPALVNLGDEIEVESHLRDGTGMPIPAASIVLYSGASFLSTNGNVQLGQTATDALGIARFSYQARTQGELTLHAAFPGNSQYGAADSSVEVTVEGSAQLTRHPTEGVRIPGIGPWILAAILGGVWSTYMVVMVLLALIAREGSSASADAGRGHG